MGRRRVYDERDRIVFRCPQDLHENIRRSADEHDYSVNLWIERATRRYLDHLRAVAAEEAPAPPWEWKQ